MVKNPPAKAGDLSSVPGSGWEDPLEEEMATHSSMLAWRIPWTEEPGGLPSMGWHSRTRLSRHAQAGSDEFPVSWGSVMCKVTGFHSGEELTHIILVGIMKPQIQYGPRHVVRQPGLTNQTHSYLGTRSTTAVLGDHCQYLDLFCHLVFPPDYHHFNFISSSFIRIY